MFQNSILTDKVLQTILQNLPQDLETCATPSKFLSNYTQIINKINQLINHVLVIGNLQLLRRHIAFELHTSSKFDSKDLESVFAALNE